MLVPVRRSPSDLVASVSAVERRLQLVRVLAPSPELVHDFLELSAVRVRERGSLVLSVLRWALG